MAVPPTLPPADSPPQPLTFLAGNGDNGTPVAGAAVASPLKTTSGIGTDMAGNVYFAGGNYILKVAPGGTMTVLAGNGSTTAPTPGPITAGSPAGRIGALTAAPDGTLYYFDRTSKSVFKLTPGGVLSRVAGTGSAGAPTAGPAAASAFSDEVRGLALDAAGNLYVADHVSDAYSSGAYLVEKITPGGTLSIIDVSSTGFRVVGVTVDAAGTVYVLTQGSQLFKLVGGTPVAVSAIPGSGAGSNGLASDAAGNVYVAVPSYGYVEKITPAGVKTRYAGRGLDDSPPVAGPATDSPAPTVESIAMDATGVLYAGTSAEGFGTFRVVRVGPTQASAPRDLTVTAGTTTLALSFLAPLNGGTTAITGYEVSLDGGTTWTALPTAALAGRITGTLSGLAAGTAYSVAVRAVNGSGSGATSAKVAATTSAAPAVGTTPVIPTPGPTVGLTQDALQDGITTKLVNGKPTVTLPLTCPPGPQGCDASGKLSVDLPTAAPRAAAAKLVPVTIASFAGVKIAAGGSRLYRVRLSTAVVQRMQARKVYKTKATLTVANHLTGGATVNSSQEVWLTVPRPSNSCSAKRAVTVHWVVRSAVRLRGVAITANGKRIKKVAGGVRKARLEFAAGQPRIVTVFIRATTTAGDRLVSMRRVRLCGAKKAGYRKTTNLVLHSTTAGSR